MKRVIYMAVLALAGCTADNESMMTENLVPLNIQAEVVQDYANTRSADGLNMAFEKGDAIMVLAQEEGKSYVPYIYRLTETGSWQPEGSTCYYPSGNKSMNIQAMYPSDALANITIPATQLTVDEYRNCDLLYVKPFTQPKPTSSPAPAIKLIFKHKMARVKVTVKSQNSDLLIKRVSLMNVRRTFDRNTVLNLSDGGVTTPSGDATTIPIGASGGASTITCAGVIPPQKIANDFVLVETNLGNVVYTLGTAGKSFGSNCEYVLQLNITRANLNTTVDISQWEYKGFCQFLIGTKAVDRVPLSAVTPTTTGMVGKVIGADNYVYDTAADAKLFTTPVAMIAYVGNVSIYCKGYAVNLRYTGSGKYSSKKDQVTSLPSSSFPSQYGSWCLPRYDELKRIFAACGGTAYTYGVLTNYLTYNYGSFITKLRENGGLVVSGDIWCYENYWVYSFTNSYFYSSASSATNNAIAICGIKP